MDLEKELLCNRYAMEFTCLSLRESDFICNVFPELAFHFNRCVGTTGEHFAFIFDPDGTITKEEFNQSIEFVKQNIGEILTYRYYSLTWGKINLDLGVHAEPIEFLREPKSLVVDTINEPKIVLLYGWTVANGSRTYGITGNGKLVPLSHESHFVEAPYSQECLIEIKKQLDTALKDYEVMRDCNPRMSFKNYESLHFKKASEFKTRFPNGIIDVVVIGGYRECSAYTTRVVDYRGGKFIAENGVSINGIVYISKSKNDDIEFCEKHVEDCHKYNQVSERYYKTIDKIHSIVAKYRRKAKGI